MAISSEPTTETEMQNFVADTMEKCGVSPDAVAIEQPMGQPGSDYFIYAIKRVNGEPMKYGLHISPKLHHPDMDAHTAIMQEAELAASQIADEFKNQITDTMRVSHTELKFSIAEGGFAECRKCNKRVTLPGAVQSIGRVAFSETPTPEPLPVDVENFVNKLDEKEKRIVKMYLFGALRQTCECQFGKTERFK